MAKPVKERAYGWVTRYLTDGDVWEEWLLGNSVEGGSEVHPSKEEVFAILPNVLRYLVEDGDLLENRSSNWDRSSWPRQFSR